MLAIDEVADRLGDRLSAARLIAIDGLPLAGKTTLAERLAAELGLHILGIDDFYLPPALWPADIHPAFPFQFSRTAEFRAALGALRRDGTCRYRPFDWQADRIGESERFLVADRPVIVEGCSALDPAIASLYDLSFFVASDAETLWEAKVARDGDYESQNWRGLFLPSDALYMATDPAARADFIVAGRGARPPLDRTVRDPIPSPDPDLLR